MKNNTNSIAKTFVRSMLFVTLLIGEACGKDFNPADYAEGFQNATIKTKSIPNGINLKAHVFLLTTRKGLEQHTHFVAVTYDMTIAGERTRVKYMVWNDRMKEQPDLITVSWDESKKSYKTKINSETKLSASDILYGEMPNNDDFLKTDLASKGPEIKKAVLKTLLVSKKGLLVGSWITASEAPFPETSKETTKRILALVDPKVPINEEIRWLFRVNDDYTLTLEK